jgi:hypothetical protein
MARHHTHGAPEAKHKLDMALWRDSQGVSGSRSRAVILPMSGRKLKFGTGGTRSMGGGFAASVRSGALAARSFTSKCPPAWSSWWRPGCSILPPVPEWRSARRACRYRR